MPGWTRVDNEIAEKALAMGPAAASVFLALSVHADADGRCWPSITRLARLCGIGRTTTIRAIKSLASAGVVVAEKGGGRASSVYALHTPNACSIATGPLDTTPPVSVVPLQDASRPVVIPQPSCGDTAAVPLQDSNKNHRTRSIEPDPLNKKRCSASQPPQGLLDLIDGWNGLPEGIVAQKARRDPPAKELLAGWNRLLKDPDSRELLADVPAILEAIRSAEFCHGQGWFTMAWLFGRNGSGELKLQKLLNGGYRQKERSNGRTQRTLPVGPGQRFDPTATLGAF